MKFVIAVVILFAAVFGVYSNPQNGAGIGLPVDLPINIGGVTDTVGDVADDATDAATGALDGVGDIVGGITGGITGGAGNPPNLSTADLAKVNEILRRAAGPKVSGLVLKVVNSLVNKALKGVPLRGLLNPTVGLVYNTLKQSGTLDKLLAGGNQAALAGQGRNITPAEQQQLVEILSRTVGPYTAAYIVGTASHLSNGLLGKIPLHQILHPVGKLVKGLLKPKSLLGNLLGQKGLVKPISRLLGAN